MAKHGTKIEWTHAPGYKGETWNPIGAVIEDPELPLQRGWFCVKVSPGCTNCYAELLNLRRKNGMGTGYGYAHQNAKHHQFRLFGLDKPLGIQGSRQSKPRCYFVNSMTDLFLELHSVDYIAQVYAVMAMAPKCLFLVLTKRAAGAQELLRSWDFVSMVEKHARDIHREYFKGRGSFDVSWPLPNVWHGVSVENQEWADIRRDQLANTPASRRFVSYEPALGPVDWAGWEFIDWMIPGGESGNRADARAPHIQWFRDTLAWCREAGIPMFFKQWGNWGPHNGEHGPHRQIVDPHTGKAVNVDAGKTKHQLDLSGGKSVVQYYRNKADAGHLIDGVEYREFPQNTALK